MILDACKTVRVRMGAAIGLALAATLIPATVTRAADLGETAPSLQWIPDNAALYSVMLRNREQLDIVRHSKAWSKLVELPIVQGCWKALQARLANGDDRLSNFRKLFENPENRQLLELFGDLLSDEVFLFAGHNSAEFLAFVTRFNSQAQYEQFSLAFRLLGKGPGGISDSNPQELPLRAYVRALSSLQDLLKVPDLVMGFRVRDTERAQAQLKRLEALIRENIGQIPPLKDRFRRQNVGQESYFVLDLDGSLIPWEESPLRNDGSKLKRSIEDEPGQLDALAKKIKQLKLPVSVGLHGQYVLLGIGVTPEYLASLTKIASGQALAARPELQPLSKFADQRLTSVSYISKDLMNWMSTRAEDLQGLAGMVNGLLPKIPLPEVKKAQLQKDIQTFANDVGSTLPVPGASLFFSFLTPRGSESYSYSWGKGGMLDGSKPLTLLHHVGGSPLVAVVWRSLYSPTAYPKLVKWIKVFGGYAEEFVVPQLTDEQRQQYETVAKTLFPLLHKLDTITGTLLIPALADGQMGFVLDGKLTSKQWFKILPPTETALPMLEPAFVIGVSDSGKLKQAMTEYRALANEASAKLHEFTGGKFPEIQIPAPRSRAAGSAELFYYPLPEGVPVDDRIMVTFGLSAKSAVVTISQEHAQRLMADRPFQGTGPLKDSQRPMAQATYVNTAGIIAIIGPWVENAVRMTEPFIRLAAHDIFSLDELPGQVRTVFDILQAFRGYASATYLENGVWATHGEAEIADR